MKVSLKELRRIVYEAVTQAVGGMNVVDMTAGGDEFAGEEPKDRLGGLIHDPRLDFSRPPPGGGRLKRQGATSSSPVLNSEGRLRHIVGGVVREALRRRK